ncbi:hypothetical protein F5X98DRAFT_303594 [Xylaria grammica]|nr:hypothetical protein F5X98DRAFT_303594 [Xylaria grammica]
MYFTQGLSNAIVGALLATTALGDSIQVPRRAAADVVAREEARAVGGMTTEAKMRKRADACINSISEKRRLAAREAKTVEIGEDMYGTGDDTIDTAGLATCFGVAFAGTWAEGKSGDFDRAMSHTYADAALDPDAPLAFIDLVDNVQEAIQAGLGVNRIVMVAADPASYTLEDGWSQEEIDMYADEYQAYLDAIAQAWTLSPEEKKHHYNEVWRLSIKSDKTIECGPEGGENKCAN